MNILNLFSDRKKISFNISEDDLKDLKEAVGTLNSMNGSINIHRIDVIKEKYISSVNGKNFLTVTLKMVGIHCLYAIGKIAGINEIRKKIIK